MPGREVVPGSTDKNQQNGPQKAASQTQESLIPASPHHPNWRKRAKPRNRKQPEVRPERYLGGLDKNTEKHLRSPQNKKSSTKHDCGNSLYGGYHRPTYRKVLPKAARVSADPGVCLTNQH